MHNKVFHKHCDILFVSFLLICFSARIAWAHGEISIIITYGRILPRCWHGHCLRIFCTEQKTPDHFIYRRDVFRDLHRNIPPFTLGRFELYWDFLILFLTIGLPIYSIPAILIGIAIGFLFKRLKKKG